MGWPAVKLKQVAHFSYGDALPSERAGEESFPVYGSNGRYAFHSAANTAAPAVVIGRKGSYGKINWSDTPCFASDTTYFIDQTATNNHLRWLYWLLQTLKLDEGSGEAAVPGLNREDAYEKVVLLPPIVKQHSIADFLDRETSKLDGLIAAKEQLIELLSEKRRALITRGVTRGLNPDAPLRKSGISWLQEIPAHWETSRLAWLFRDRDERREPDLPLLEVSINAGVVLREFSDDRIETTASDFNSYKVARKGDIVFNKMRMWQGAVGLAPEDGLVSPDYTVAAPTGDMSPDYAALLFRTEMFSAECARNSHGIVWDRLRLYWEGFREIVVPVPPSPEQGAIVAYVDRETSKLDALKVASESTIALLKERRATLITATVTGTIKV